MFFKIIMYYILGYVNISVEGYFIERFINICISKNILLWNLKRKKSSFLYTNIGMKDFKKIKNIAKITKCRVKIEKKKGLPFIINKYKKRKIFIFSLILIILLIFGISNFIWNIEITGNERIETSEILKDLEENGLSIGKLKKNIDTKKIITEIRLNRNDIAWMGIHLDGTNAKVEIVETDEKPDIIDESEYCNIVSSKDGLITKVNAQNGTALVKEGDIVKKGSVLIAGWLEGKYTGTRYVHAKGEVEAKVWYSKKEQMELQISKNEETGNEKNCYGIKINNFKINFGKKVPNFQKYDTINENKKLKIFSNFYFPIEFCKTIYKELEEKNVTYSAEEAKEILVEKIKNELDGKIENKDKIVNVQINDKQLENTVEVEVIYEVLENIETNEKIVF